MDSSAVLPEFIRRLRLMFYLNPVSAMTLNESDPVPPIIVDGIPMFFVLMLIELIGMKLIRLFMSKEEKKHSPNYRWNDFVCSLSLGAVQQASQLILDLAGLKLATVTYEFVYYRCRLFDIDMHDHQYFYFFAIMLGYDCGYYWFHRTVHEYHLLWALGHSVHHSGESYNLACALRQGAGQGFTSWPFYLPLALVGFPPAAFAAHSQCNTLYQFWVHTEMIGRLGPLEMLLSTPAAHRMHHKPPGNCNYAGVFIIWDKIFGTYVPEIERMDYFGIAGQPQTFNPLKLNTQHFPKMMNIQGKVTSFAGRLVAKRANHKAVFDLMALFRPMPPLKSGPRASSWKLNLSGSKRKKFDGEREMSWSTLVFFVVTSMAAFIFSYGVLIATVAGYLEDEESIKLTAAGIVALTVTSTVSDKGAIGVIVPGLVAAFSAFSFAKKDDLLALAEAKLGSL